ncbi:hypothetical protein R1sor_022183 [Riccia sorocarpa]|uniref:Uncharacterized protein n=1 Tax=Riccia sorocarpa TaxID=122646 RepID=A0ABD3GL26_9MARC
MSSTTRRILHAYNRLRSTSCHGRGHFLTGTPEMLMRSESRSASDDSSLDDGGGRNSTVDPDVTFMNFVYREQCESAFAKDYELWKFDVNYLVNQDALVNFLRRLKQVQLLDFFQRIALILDPRALILNFILESRIDRSSNSTGVLRYELQRLPGLGEGQNLRLKLTRESFANILGLPMVESEAALDEYRFHKLFQASAVGWLGVISAILCASSKNVQGWNQAWEIWQKESDTPVIKTCREACRHVQRCHSRRQSSDPNNFGRKMYFMEEDQ